MSAENHQARPLTPSKIPHRSNEEFAPVFKPRPSSGGRSNKCPVYLLTAVVLVTAIALIFSLIVLRPANPEFDLHHASVKFLNYTSSYPAPWLNATIAAQATLRNNNFGRFEFESANLTLTYNGTVVGEKALGGGTVRLRQKKDMNITFAVGSSRISDLKNLSRDMSDDVLELMSYATLRGRVHLIKIVNRRLTSEMNCTMRLFLANRTVDSLICL